MSHLSSSADRRPLSTPIILDDQHTNEHSISLPSNMLLQPATDDQTPDDDGE